jgi:hypothetical protein
VIAGIVVIEVLALCLPAEWWAVAGLSVLLLAILSALLLEMVRGHGEGIVVAWILIFPLGYYFLAYPREHSIITLDRVLIGVLLVAAIFIEPVRIVPIPAVMRRPAVWWSIFLLFSAIATLRTIRTVISLHLWFDAFVCPALFAWYVLRCIDVRKYLSLFHIVTCVMSLYVAAIGGAEILTQQDLMSFPDSSTYVAGDTRGPLPEGGIGDFLIRPNGPFSTNNTFAMDGLVSLFFLLFIKQALQGKMPAWQRLLHRFGAGAALAQALMPLFRSVLISLAVVLLVDAVYQHGRRRTVRVVGVLSLGFIFLLLRLAMPAAFEDRTDPENIYSRVAQQGQTFAIFLDNPLNGVGLGNFNKAAQHSKYMANYRGLDPADYPHSNLGAILAETGLTGFVPFVVSQVLFVVAFWKLRQRNSAESRLAWKTFLFIFLCYWINGLSLTIAYYGDLNLWYMLVLAIIYKFGVKGSTALPPTPCPARA